MSYETDRPAMLRSNPDYKGLLNVPHVFVEEIEGQTMTALMPPEDRRCHCPKPYLRDGAWWVMIGERELRLPSVRG